MGGYVRNGNLRRGDVTGGTLERGSVKREDVKRDKCKRCSDLLTFSRFTFHRLLVAVVCAVLLAACVRPAFSDVVIERQPDGIVAPIGDGFLNVQVWGDDIIHVMFAKSRKFFAHKSLTVVMDHSDVPTFGYDSDGQVANF